MSSVDESLRRTAFKSCFCCSLLKFKLIKANEGVDTTVDAVAAASVTAVVVELVVVDMLDERPIDGSLVEEEVLDGGTITMPETVVSWSFSLGRTLIEVDTLKNLLMFCSF